MLKFLAGNELREVIFRNELDYLCEPPRVIIYLEVGGKEVYPFNQSRYLQCEEMCRNSAERLVELCGCEESLSSDSGGRVVSTITGVAQETHFTGGKLSVDRRSGKEKIAKKIFDLIMKHGVAPPERITETDLWYGEKNIQFLTSSDKLVISSINILQMKLNSWKLIDYINYFKDCNWESLYYESSDCLTANIYMNLVDSCKSLLDLLFTQYLSIGAIQDFLETLERWFDRDLQNNKINTIQITGPPNCGKSFFFDTFCNFILNYGNLTSPSRIERFAFMDCINRRIIKWNEAKLDPAYNEMFLDLMQGNSVKVNVKFRNPTNVCNTPLLVIANNEVFPNEERFNIRQIKYVWKVCSKLKMYNKKPNPFAMCILFQYFIYNENNKHCNISNMVEEIKNNI